MKSRFLALAAVLTASSLQASTIFSYVSGSASTAGQFGILAGSNTTSSSFAFQQSNENWTAQSGTLNVGIGAGVKVQFSGPGTFSGDMLYEDSTPVSGTTYSNFSPTGGVTFGQASVINAISAATQLSTYFVTNQTGASTYTGGSLTVSGGGVHYYTVTSNLNLSNAVFTGSSSDVIVINVSSNAQVNFNGTLTLSGGLTADNVVFNFTGTSNFGGTNNGGNVYADIISTSAGNDALDNLTFDGRIFDVATNGSLQLVSGLNLNAPAPLASATPEPSSVILLASGLVMICFGARRLRKV